jgi:predicted ATPase/DNA-binding SARP family transcriptional activator
MRLQLLGSPVIEHGGALHALPFERRSQLLVLLALRRGWTTRAELAGLLWPEQESKLAFTNLRKTLFRLSALPWPVSLETQAAALRFEPATDVLAFEAALKDERIDEALALYRGELLAGFDDGQSEPWTRWVEFERERLRAAWRAAALARLADESIDAAAAVALATRLLDADPLDEAVLGALMRWLQRAGQPGAARQAWREFVERLRHELGLEPGAGLRALQETLGLPSPAAIPVDAPASAPLADESFVGRSVECQRIGALLGREECRLLCLVGPGGVGKTRLARRTMALLMPQFADGALFVELEDATTPEQLGSALVRAANAGRGRGDEALTQAIEALREREMLLVLDNFEQLAEHASVLERLLQGCARVKLLVTSRVRLPVAGEWSMPVEGLPWPEPEDEDRAGAFDAVRLFVKAAQRVEPRFAVAAEQHAIVDICRQVEGLPLAIELAAAWVRMLPCESIAAELREGSELLRARDAAHPARHASIEQVFEQSWQRLSPSERDVLARLSVFRGGFTAEAARAVAGASLPVLGALADKSLLRKEGTRLQLHPLMQQLAALRLTDPALLARTQAAHAAQFHALLQQLAPRLDSGEGRALDAVDAEFENLRKAWATAVEAGQADVLVRSIPPLISHCENRARFEDGLALLRPLAASPLAQRERRLRAAALAYGALFEYRVARYEQAEANAREALAAATSPREWSSRLQAMKVLSSCASITGRLAEAQSHCREALALARTLASGVAQALENLSLVEKRLGDYEQSLQLQAEALALYRHDGNLAALAVGLTNLASMCMFMDDFDEAASHLREALALAEREGLTSTRAFALANLTELALKRQDWPAAQTHAQRSLELSRGNGMRMLSGWLEAQLARLALRRDALDEARAGLCDAVRTALALAAPALKSAALLAFAELAAAQGHAAAARRVLAFGAAHEAIGMADRDELRVEWARRSTGLTDADPPWPPALALDDLLQRIVDETPSQHARLFSQLR